MDVPAPQPGKVISVAVKRGAKVKAGDVILTLAPSDAGVSAEAPRAAQAAEPPQGAGAESGTSRRSGTASAGRSAARPLRLARLARARRALPTRAAAALQPSFGPRLVVIGAGPGGYTAAFRAADLGLAGHARRALADARRSLLERRLHSVEGAAARGARDRGSARDGRERHRVRRAEGRHGKAARLEEQSRCASSPAVSTCSRSSARYASCAAARVSRRRISSRSSATERARRSTSTNASSRPAASRPRCRTCRAIRGSSIPPARSSLASCPSECS